MCCIISHLKLALVPGFPSSQNPISLLSSMAKLRLRADRALSPHLPFSLAPAPNGPWSPLHCCPISHSQQTLSSGSQHGRQSCQCPPGRNHFFTGHWDTILSCFPLFSWPFLICLFSLCLLFHPLTFKHLIALGLVLRFFLSALTP